MIFFDMESDGLLEAGILHGAEVRALTQIHCINVYDGSTHKHERYDAQSMPIALGVKRIAEADAICGHNIIGYDIPAIQRIFPGFEPKGKIYDTLPMARLCFPLVISFDFARVKAGRMPADLIGKHTLESWGYRMGVLKGDFAKTTDWDKWTPQMSDYCEQDVVVAIRLYEIIMDQHPSSKAVALEMEVADIINHQQRNGIRFDSRKAEKLLQKLTIERNKNEEIVFKSFHPFYKLQGKTFVPKRDNKRLGYVTDAPCSKIVLCDFKATSNQHVYVWLRRKYGWEPVEFTKKSKVPEQFRYLFTDYFKQLGNTDWLEPKINDVILERLYEDYPEAEPIHQVQMLSKRISQLAIGKQAWMKRVGPDGIIHGAVNTLGTRTRRMTHFYPNLAQVPAVYSPYGPECRDLFIPVRKGWVMLGADAASLEARVLAHFTFPFDNGSFAKLILSGELHNANATVLGISRGEAKTFFYAFLYGAGNKKLGNIAKKNADYGKRMRDILMKEQPGLGKLIKALKDILKKRGFLYDLDGQKLPSVSDHSALNTLCQSAGGVIMKRALVIFDKAIGGRTNKYLNYMLNVHDEFGVEVHPKYADEYGKVMVDSMTKAGEYYKLNIPLTGEYKIGKSWKETH